MKHSPKQTFKKTLTETELKKVTGGAPAFDPTKPAGSLADFLSGLFKKR